MPETIYGTLSMVITLPWTIPLKSTSIASNVGTLVSTPTEEM